MNRRKQDRALATRHDKIAIDDRETIRIADILIRLRARPDRPHLWPGASLGLKVLPLEALHSDLDIITRTLGLPEDLTVTTVDRHENSAAIDVAFRFVGATARSSVSSLMPMPWGARGG